MPKVLANGIKIHYLQVGEGPEFKTFRLGLFGLDKLADVEGTLARLKVAVDKVL